MSTKARQSSLTSVATQLGLRGLGMVLSLLISVMVAFFFGAGAAADAFYFVRRLIGSWTLLFDALMHAIMVPRIVISTRQQGIAQVVRQMRKVEVALLGVGAVVGIGCLLVTDPLLDALAPGLTGEARDFSRVFLQLIAVAFPAVALTSLTSAQLNAMRQFSAPTVMRMLPRLLILLAICATPFGMGIQGLVLASVGGQLLMLVFYLFHRRRLLKDNTPPLESAKSEDGTEKRALRQRSVAMIFLSLYFVITTTMETYFASLAGAGAIAILTLAQRVSNLGVSELMRGVLSVYYTNFAERAGERDNDAYLTEISHAIRVACFFSAPLTLFLAAAALPLSSLLFGHGAFLEADVAAVAGLITLFSAAILLNVPVLVLENALMAHPDVHKGRHFALAVTIALIVRLAVLVLCLPWLGLAALGWAAIAGTLPLLFFHLGQVSRTFGKSLDRSSVAQTAHSIFAAAGAATIVWLSLFWWETDATKSSSLLALVQATGLFGLLYLAMIWTADFPELARVRSIITRRRF